MSTHDDLRMIALREFAIAGYSATSLQRIAEIAGVSKSSVLYHYDSKEALLETAIAPAIDKITAIVDSIDGSLKDPVARHDFIARFVDVLLQHRLEVNIFINQGLGLQDVPVIQHASVIVLRFKELFASVSSTLVDHLRFGIALGGAAYVLAATDWNALELDAPVEDIREALITVMSELLDPLSAHTAAASTLVD